MTRTEQFNQNVIKKAQAILKHAFLTKIEITSFEFLSEEGRRNSLLRLFIKGDSQSLPKSVILKQLLREQTESDDDAAYARFARDWAALEFIQRVSPNTHNVPKFYGGHAEERFIIIEDLGQRHTSLVDSLTLPGRDKALASLDRYMRALAGFHGASFGQIELYNSILKKIHPEAKNQEDHLAFILSEALAKLLSLNSRLGLSLSDECKEEVQMLITSVLEAGPFSVLTHGDICPDNVFDHEDKKNLQLIDFEWSFVRSALLDATYLRMNMPTCWCVKALPKEVIDAFDHLYRIELTRSVSAAKETAAYNKAYTEACGFWLLQQSVPFAISVLDQDRIGSSGPIPKNSLWENQENWIRPRVLSGLQAFIEVASQNALLPHVKQMAQKSLMALEKRWPDTKPLSFYPAFINTGKLLL